MILNDKNKNDFLNLLINIVNDQINVSFDNLDVDAMHLLATHSSLNYLINRALKKHNYKTKDINPYIFQVAHQEEEKKIIYRLFNENQIMFVPLKGAILRSVYPDIYDRSMADIDLLCKESDFPKIKDILTSNNYPLAHHTFHHDCFIKKPYINIEIHKSLTSINNKEIYDYYLDVFEKVNKYNDYEYHFSDDDFYIYMIVHAAKHFSIGGCGVRILLDVYYYNSHKKLNFEYISSELDKLHLKQFNDRLLNIIKIFDGETIDNDSTIILDFLLTSGVYGNISNSSVVGVIDNKDASLKTRKRKYILRKMFPSFKMMRTLHPSLKYFPFLLPWFWFLKIFKGLFTFKTNMRKIKRVTEVNQSEIDKMKKIREISGIRGIYED